MGDGWEERSGGGGLGGELRLVLSSEERGVVTVEIMAEKSGIRLAFFSKITS